MKTCTKCKKELPPTEFHKNNTKKDKLSNVCKSCSNIATREWQEKNREHHNKQQREQKVNRNKRGLCCHGLNKKLPTSTMCEKHWYEGVSRSHFKLDNHSNWCILIYEEISKNVPSSMERRKNIR